MSRTQTPAPASVHVEELTAGYGDHAVLRGLDLDVAATSVACQHKFHCGLRPFSRRASRRRDDVRSATG